MFRLEDQKKSLLRTPGVIGVDEAGRGPLAGPVVAAAVVLPDGFDLRGLDDSKKLKAEVRRDLYARIRAEAACAWHVVDAPDIDQINILQATFAAMRGAIEKLGPQAREALIDGDRVPPGLAVKAAPVVKGDATYASIAAASIVAKEVRDELMLQYAVQYPRYGFHRHMGYGTPEHLAALQMHGPCPIHRRTFARVRELIEQPCLTLEV
jgi:ribonuclease HII